MKRRQFLLACGAAGLGGCATATPDGDTGDPTEAQTGSPDREGTPTVSRTRTNAARVEGSWPLADCDAGNTGYNIDAGGIGPEAGRRWKSSIDANILSTPSVAGDVAFTGGDTRVFAYDVADGEKEWIVDVGDKTAEYTPVVAGDTVCQSAGAADGTVVALDRTSGEERWRATISNPTQAIATDDALYVGATADGRARVRSLTLSGEPNWTFEVPTEDSAVQASPAADGTAVYALVNRDGASEGSGLRLYSLATDDGSEQWHCDLSGGANAAPVAGDDRVYVPSTDGTVSAVGKSSAEPEWTLPTGAPVSSSPALADGRLYAGNLNGDFYAIDAATGTDRWRTDTNVSNTSPAVAGDTVYVGGGPVYALAADDGSIEWSYREDAFSTSFYSPALAGDALYIGICLKDHPKEYYDNYLYQFSS